MLTANPDHALAALVVAAAWLDDGEFERGYIAAVGLPDRYPRTVTALELACRGQLPTDRWRAHRWREPSALSQVGEAIVTITVGGST